MQRADTAIAETLGWDVSEVREYQYQRYTNPAVYSIGQTYYAFNRSKPKHEVGQDWVLHPDQFASRNSKKKVWISSAITRTF